jgi:hypothetical protein
MKNIILTLVLALTVVGCSGKDPFNRESNPLKEYPGLKDSVAPHDEKTRTQYYVSDVFDIAFEEQQESRRILNFVAGEKTQHKVRARVYLEGLKFDLKASNLPSDATFVKSTTEENIWLLTWTPKVIVQKNIQIELVPLNAGQQTLNSLPSQIERTVNFSLVVQHTEKEPAIVKVSGLEGDIKENSTVKFKVQIADPASYTKSAPILTWGFDQSVYSTDNKVFSGQNGIDWDYSNLKPKLLSNGNWEYSLVYFPALVADLHRKDATGGKIKVQFNLQAVSSVSEELSPAYAHPLNIVLEAQAGE